MLPRVQAICDLEGWGKNYVPKFLIQQQQQLIPTLARHQRGELAATKSVADGSHLLQHVREGSDARTTTITEARWQSSELLLATHKVRTAPH